jgi:SSS family solute:Na+ symporter
MSAARRTPLIAAYPKPLIPLVTVIPGLIALVTVPGLGGSKTGDFQYNNAIPLLMRDLLPNGVLGVAVTGLLASFMAGMAANISGFNTVFTYDIWQPYIVKNRPDGYYLKVGRVITVVGVVIGIGTAFIAAGYNNIMNYLQALFSLFNAPLFATFIIALFWKRMSAWAGFIGLLSGMVASALIGFVVVAIVSVIVTMVTQPKPESELDGLVYGVGSTDVRGDALVGDRVWYRNPILLGTGALVLAVVFYLPFW